jgi:hypothetical protein
MKHKDVEIASQVNRMRDSLDLFKTLINWKKKNYITKSSNNSTNQNSNSSSITKVKETLLFERVSIILFLNKEDLFEEKFKLSSPSVCFDDYDEHKHGASSSQAKEFIARKFIECDCFYNKNTINGDDDDNDENSETRRDIYWHYTYALDRKNVETVVASVKDRILKYMLESMRL